MGIDKAIKQVYDRLMEGFILLGFLESDARRMALKSLQTSAHAQRLVFAVMEQTT